MEDCWAVEEEEEEGWRDGVSLLRMAESPPLREMEMERHSNHFLLIRYTLLVRSHHFHSSLTTEEERRSPQMEWTRE